MLNRDEIIMDNKPIMLISSGIINKKKDFLEYNTESLYLNFSLLGLATILASKGYENVKMFQGDNKSIDEIINEIYSVGISIEEITHPVFISIPSFYAVPWTKIFSERIKQINGKIRIIAGGRWVIDNNEEWIRGKLIKVDVFCHGCQDDFIDKYLYFGNWEEISKNQSNQRVKTFDFLDYSLLNNFHNYQPSIEVSRGCKNRCVFCAEKYYSMSEIKDPEKIISEALDICKTYNNEELNFYFESSNFLPSADWASKFNKCYHRANARFQWRFETRVDSIDLNAIGNLAKSGLKVIDLGLESGSKEQLIRMEKTKRQEDYLIKAEKLLDTLSHFDIWAKLNIMLFWGETKKTLEETTDWLNKNKGKYKGISVNPYILFLNGEYTEELIKRIYNITKINPNKQDLYENGYTLIDLSHDFHIEDIKNITNEIIKKFMPYNDYLELKSISYTRRK